MNNEILNTFYQIRDQVNAEMKVNVDSRIRDQDTYGVTEQLIKHLAKHDDSSSKRVTIKCNPSIVVFLESNNLYFDKIKNHLPFQLELNGDPDLESRNDHDKYIFVTAYKE